MFALVFTLSALLGSVSACTVERISDGDSFVCTGGTKVRLLLVDAPELAQSPHGSSARKAFLALAPKGTPLRLETDVVPNDKFGRVLAYAYLPDGRMLNEELAKAGYVTSLVYPPNVRHVERVRAAVKTAREAKVGLWAYDGFRCQPRDFRHGRCR